MSIKDDKRFRVDGLRKMSKAKHKKLVKKATATAIRRNRFRREEAEKEEPAPIIDRKTALDMLGYKSYKKVVTTRAKRLEFPFKVETKDGISPVFMDGYILIDSGGYPYPMSKEEFERTYEEGENASEV